MTKFASLLTLLVSVLGCLLPAAPALAQRDRVFVASYGSDSNPCTFGSPCKTFQNAVNVVAQGGEVTAIDSAGFGTFTISHAVTITSPNGVEAGVAAPASGSAAITINAGSSDVISLNGLTLDGDNITNTTGILFNSGGSLEIQNSVIRSFAGTGVAFEPNSSSQLSVSNTLVSNNTSNGILISPTGTGTVIAVLDHVGLNTNVDGLSLSGNASQGAVQVTVSDSVAANSFFNGIVASNPSSALMTVMVRNSTIANNPGNGLFASKNSTIWVTRSTIIGNGTGWKTQSGGVLNSFNDNNIVGNTAGDGAPPLAGYE